MCNNNQATSMKFIIDIDGNEHYCNDKLKDTFEELVNTQCHSHHIIDCMNRFMAATGDVVDLANEKEMIERAIVSMHEKYQEHAIKMLN